MSNVIIGIIGVILFIGMAVAGAVYLGPKFLDSRIDAEAIGYLNQSSQISKAVEDYSSDRGRLPIEAGREPVEILVRSEEHTSELQSLMRISYAVFCLKKKK